MSELCAFIFYVVFQEVHQEFEDTTISYFVNLENLELNTYFLFDKLMKVKMKEFFRFEIKNQNGKRTEIPINKKSVFIFKKLLKVLDEELFNHMNFHRFQPIISCLKWVRLLFLRDFEFQECQIVWDFILKNIEFKVEVYDFKNNRPLKEDGEVFQFFDILDFICAAIYILLKQKIMNQECEMGIIQVLQNNQEMKSFDVLKLAENLIS